MLNLKITPTERLMEAIRGATIDFGYVENEEGMHLRFSDGRVLVIAGVFALSLIHSEQEYLH